MQRNKALKILKELKKHSKELRLAAEEWDEPWQNLISTMLSARTRDEVTIEVCNVLFKKYPTVKKLASAKLSEVKKIIKPVNFYKTKSRNILECAKILAKKYKCSPPLEFDKLVELPGVGRKTANVFLSEMGKDEIGIDTHVFQISRKLGWTKHTKPELIENDLKKLFPQKLWKEVNSILVRFGRTHRGKKQEEMLKKIKNTTN